MTQPFDPAEDFVVRCRIDEIIAEQGFTSRAKAIEALKAYGVGANVVHRLANGHTKGIDFATLVRLCVGLRCSIDQLLVIEAREDAVNAKNALDATKA